MRMCTSCKQWLTCIGVHLLIVAVARANTPEVCPSQTPFSRESVAPSSHATNSRWEVDEFIKPFDEARELPWKPQGIRFKHIGHVEVLRPNLAKPSMFSACFTISSRRRSQAGLCLKQNQIGIEMVRGKDRKKDSFHYDIRDLAPNYINAAFNVNRRTIVVIPGYLTDREEWQREITDSWLELEDVNVIEVHWPKGNHRLVYESAASNVAILARQITILLYYLATLHGREFKSRQFRSSIHLVGHSLGAHVAGFVGKELEGQVDRITALDPAGPIFEDLHERRRLRRTDANFVDVLHTNAGQINYIRAGVAALKKVLSILWDAIAQKKTCAGPNSHQMRAHEEIKLSQVRRTSDSNNTAWFGFEQPLGHMDYYANGGSIQPGCLGDFHICDHGRATTLYVASLKREIVARELFGLDSSVIREKKHRLFAFRQREYKVFQSGGRVHRECAKFFLANSYGNAKERRETHRRCTVPIDFISSGSDLRKELTEDYRINLADTSRKRRYYFETLDQHPYVSEQMLMRIHTKETPTNSNTWSDRCRLAALVRPPGREIAFAQADQRPQSARPIEQAGFSGHIFPVANTNDWTKKYLLPDAVKLVTFESKESAFLHDRLISYLPPYVIVKLGYKDAKSGLVKYFEGDKMVENCLMTIVGVELRSLVSADVSTNLTLWYTAHYATRQTIESQESLLKNNRKLEKPVVVSTLDHAQAFFLSFIGVGDQPSD